MTCAMKSRILVGYVVSILVFFFGPFVQDLSATGFMDYGEDNPQEVADAAGLPLEVFLDTVDNMTLRTFVTCGIVLAVLVVGLGACVAIHQTERIKSKQPVLYITGAVYLIYITVMACDFSLSSQVWWPYFGSASWIIRMIFYEMGALFPLLFMGLPFLATLELVFAAILAFLVIVPLTDSSTGYNLWEMFSVHNLKVRPVPRSSPLSLSLFLTLPVASYLSRPSLGLTPFLCLSPLSWSFFLFFINQNRFSEMFGIGYCVENEKTCVIQTRWLLVFPFIVVTLLMLAILFVSYLVERANRQSFEWKKIMQCQKEKLVLTARLREEFLVSEHKRKEELIVDLFENF